MWLCLVLICTFIKYMLVLDIVKDLYWTWLLPYKVQHSPVHVFFLCLEALCFLRLGYPSTFRLTVCDTQRQDLVPRHLAIGNGLCRSIVCYEISGTSGTIPQVLSQLSWFDVFMKIYVDVIFCWLKFRICMEAGYGHYRVVALSRYRLVFYRVVALSHCRVIALCTSR